MTQRPPRYSPRLDDALGFVADAFRHRVRKGTEVPYLTHLLQVMVHVAEHGGDEDQQIAALLHDWIEDIPGADRAVLEARFGERVAGFVVALSDSFGHPKPPWEERKRAYVAKLALEPPELKLISTADKLHNARSMVRDLKTIGDALWGRFTGNREQTLWYYREILAALGTGWSHVLLEELRDEVARLHEVAERVRTASGSG